MGLKFTLKFKAGQGLHWCQQSTSVTPSPLEDWGSSVLLNQYAFAVAFTLHFCIYLAHLNAEVIDCAVDFFSISVCQYHQTANYADTYMWIQVWKN